MHKMLEYPFDSQQVLRKRRAIRKELLSGGNLMEKHIAILGGSTTHDVKDMLELFLLNQDIRPVFYESEYAQYWQDAMFPNEELQIFKPDVIYIHTSNRNITAYPEPADTVAEVDKLLEREYSRFTAMWDSLRKSYHCPVIQNNFEYPFYRILGNQDAADIHGRVNFITRLNLKFCEYAHAHEGFFIHDINYLSADYGLEKWSDPFFWYMYKYALCLDAIPRLAFSVSNIIKSIFGKNKKAFALDLDNTLWGGIVGDDGVENLALGQETSMGQVYTEFQQYLQEMKKRGILLNVVSKNEYENAIAGLNHPDGVLKPEDFIVIKANWEPKSVNLVQVAQELSLLPESLVFVDDNPAERTIIRQQVPGAAVPELDTVERYIQIIDRSGFFESTSLSADDLKRNEMYKANAARSLIQNSFSSYEDYLLSLDMRATIKPFEPIYMSRIAQLTNKSNQFNLTTRRYTQEEIEQTAADLNYITLYGKLEDRFGDNGVVTVVIGKVEGKRLDIILWLMSCRVLKRDMEFAMMDELAACCQKRGIVGIHGFYYPTAKNGMVRDFYERQGFIKLFEDDQGNTLWELDLSRGYTKKNKVIQINQEKESIP